MKRGDKKEGNHEAGSCWTSYSDMLVGLSEVCLVLFFVSTLRSGMEQLKMQAEKQTNEDYLNGKVPKEVTDKNKATRDLAVEKIKDIVAKKEMLVKDMEHVKDFVKNLDSQKSVID